MPAGRKKGARKTGGRKKGTPNKVTKSVRESILAAFQSVGGEEYLAKQAALNPNAFLTLLGKVLPTQITGDTESPLQHLHRIERVIVDPAAN